MKYVVLGASAAGINGARELRKQDPNGEIVLISKDEAIYSRCILHHYLSGHRNLSQISFAEADFAQRYQIHWIKGQAAVSLNPQDKVVTLENGDAVSYDKLLIATGSHSFVPPIKNVREAVNKTGFRNLEDMEILKTAAAERKNIVVMGAGLVGLDCTSGLLELGVSVTLIDLAGWMLSRQLDPKAAARYQEAFAKKGVQQLYGIGISEAILNEKQEITELILSDGSHLPCDFLVLTAGVRANVEFLEGSGIETSRFGLVYDETGKTSDPDVYGAGDVSGTSPIWPVAVKEGIIAADNMTGKKRRMSDFFASKSTMNFLGIAAMSLGDVNAEEGCQVEICETKDSYKKIIHKDGQITAALLVEDLAYGGVLQQLIARKIDITKVKKPVFDIDYSDFFHIKENFEFTYEEDRKGE